jgi:hypothetical protein
MGRIAQGQATSFVVITSTCRILAAATSKCRIQDATATTMSVFYNSSPTSGLGTVYFAYVMGASTWRAGDDALGNASALDVTVATLLTSPGMTHVFSAILDLA